MTHPRSRSIAALTTLTLLSPVALAGGPALSGMSAQADSAETAISNAADATPSDRARLFRSSSANVTGLAVGWSRTFWKPTVENSVGIRLSADGRESLELNDNVTMYMIGNITVSPIRIHRSCRKSWRPNGRARPPFSLDVFMLNRRFTGFEVVVTMIYAAS